MLVAAASSSASSSLPSSSPSPLPSLIPASLVPLCLYLSQFPIVQFYIYLYRTAPFLCVASGFVSFVLPIVLEALPWYLSRRQLAKILRESKNAIQHRLIANHPFSSSSLFAFTLFSLIYSLLTTAEELLRTRLLLANRLIIKRLMMERILYSEIGSLQARYRQYFHGDQQHIQTELLEMFVMNDINETLQLFNTTIPTLIRNGYTLLFSSMELYAQRAHIDLLSIVRPTVIGIMGESLNLIRDRWVTEPQTLQLQMTYNNSHRIVSNIVDGLSEIQVNNMQGYQLLRLDHINAEQVNVAQGVSSFLNSVYRILNGRSVLDFVSEVYVVKIVMERQGISHEQYRAVQNDIDYITRLWGRMYQLMREAWRILDTQQRVRAILNLPSFEHETSDDTNNSHRTQSMPDHQPEPASPAFSPSVSRIPCSSLLQSIGSPFEFQSLVIRRLWFRYNDASPWALKIGRRRATGQPMVIGSIDDDEDEEQGGDGRVSADAGGDLSEIRFERGKTYAIVGQNRSGKSTLVQILCKLYHPASTADAHISLNDLPFDQYPRIDWRTSLSYIAQRPFIFPGTIEDNIRMGNQTATPQQVEQAARAAGIFLLETPRTLTSTAVPASSVPSSAGSLVQRDESLMKLKPWELNRTKGLLTTVGGWIQSGWQQINLSMNQWSEGDEDEDEEDDYSPSDAGRLSLADVGKVAQSSLLSPSISAVLSASLLPLLLPLLLLL